MLVIISNTWLQPKLLHCIVGLQVFPFTYWMACRGWSHSLLRGDWLTMETFFREARSKMSIKAFWSGGIWCQQLLLRIVGGQCRLYLWISCSHRHNVSGKELGFFFPPVWYFEALSTTNQILHIPVCSGDCSEDLRTSKHICFCDKLLRMKENTAPHTALDISTIYSTTS